MKIILLLPIVLFLIIILGNSWLLLESQSIDILWIVTLDMPVALFTSVFLVTYAVLLFFIYDWIHAYSNYKIEKLEKLTTDLKASLYDGQDKLISKITKEFETYHNNSKNKDKDSLEKYISNNEKTLENMKKENEANLDRMRSETDRVYGEISTIYTAIPPRYKKK